MGEGARQSSEFCCSLKMKLFAFIHKSHTETGIRSLIIGHKLETNWRETVWYLLIIGVFPLCLKKKKTKHIKSDASASAGRDARGFYEQAARQRSANHQRAAERRWYKHVIVAQLPLHLTGLHAPEVSAPSLWYAALLREEHGYCGSGCSDRAAAAIGKQKLMSWDKYLLMYINISGLVSSLVRVLRGVLVKKMLLKEAEKKKKSGSRFKTFGSQMVK